MIARLPKYAERKFALLCSDMGALAHKAEEDENGWDFLVEFPRPKLSTPADTHPPPNRAYVQVKSTRTANLSCRLKLSNALSAAQGREPWFVVLLSYDATRQATKIYAVHIWDGLIRRILEEVRLADNAKVPLNKRRFVITFGLADRRGEGLITWMHETITSIGADYDQQKKKLFESVGYEDGHGTGRLTVEAETIEQIENAFLGLGEGLKVRKFVYTPQRFGIPNPKPMVDSDDGKIVIKPEAVGSCEIRFRCAKGAMSLPGQVYAFAPPGRPLDQARIRFAAKFLDLVCQPAGKDIAVSSTMNRDERVSLATLEHHALFAAWLAVGSVNVQIWSSGRRILMGGLQANSSSQISPYWAKVSEAIKMLRRVVGATEGQILMSLSELAANMRAVDRFRAVNSDVNIGLEFIPFEGMSPKATSLVSYSYVKVGEYTFFIMTDRPVIEDAMIQEETRARRITCGKPHFVDAYALQNATEENLRLMESDYNSYCDRGDNGTPFGAGNINYLLASAPAE